jgi:hypothetical protein
MPVKNLPRDIHETFDKQSITIVWTTESEKTPFINWLLLDDMR